MKTAIADVTAFHRACDVPVLDVPQIPIVDRVSLRYNLIHEEINDELLPAMMNDNLVEIADAIADSIYVLIGTALEYGIPLERVWSEVQRSNMSKMDPVSGRAIKREDGKVLKGPNFSPANVVRVLAEGEHNGLQLPRSAPPLS